MAGRKKILHLTRNERSGQDKWFSNFLNACREGTLKEDDYNYIHGYPTKGKIDFWYEQRNTQGWIHDDENCSGTPYSILDHWNIYPTSTRNKKIECKFCWQERKRRARVLHMDRYEAYGRERLEHPDFAESVLITQYNMSAFHFAQQRAISFAKQNQRQAFWIQATDTPPSWFCSGYSMEDLQDMKRKWLSYHARKTEGILSLLLCCYDMPLIVKNSGGPEYRKYGVHNGARCRLKAWDLEEDDEKTIRENRKDPFIVLKFMPKVLYIEMEKPLKEPYPDLPENWFPLKPVDTYWCLDPTEHIEISRRGFPLVPNFATTIDGATGQTLRTGIADLGDFSNVPSFHGAMLGYIALSRVTAADKLLIARPFNLLLFRLGPQPFPTLLFNTLEGAFDNMPERAFIQKCGQIEHSAKEKQLLKNLHWTCSECNETLHQSLFLGKVPSEIWMLEYEKNMSARSFAKMSTM